VTLRIQCWSGPRNISTALMYSFRERSDTTVVDEPLYAHYLHMDERGHPGAAAVMAGQSTDADDVIDTLILGACASPVRFIKQMAHHLQGVRRDFLGLTENILLTRDPREMLPSLAAHLPHCGLADTGLEEQVKLLDAIVGEGGTPLVIDSQVLLHDPPGVLTAVCERFGLAFEEAMLTWPPGPKPEDGAWAPEWYENVHKSTGFGPYTPRTDPVPTDLVSILDEAAPLYDHLRAYAIEG
jgi:hypothetical protein